MRTIHLITSHFPPEITAASHRMESFVKTLSENDVVHVFTLTEPGVKPAQSHLQVSDNVYVHYIYLQPYPKNDFFFRAWAEARYSWKLVRRATEVSADITLASAPFIFLIPTLALQARDGKKIIDVRDLTWNYLPENNTGQRFIKKIISRVIQKILARFDHVIVTNPAEKKWMRNTAGIPEGKTSIIANGISSERFERISSLTYHPAQQPKIISYIGNIGDGQDLLPAVEAITGLPDVRLNLIGEGIETSRIRAYLRTNAMHQVIMHGKLPWNRILPFYQSSSILFARLGKNYGTAVPSKLFEYLATGLPVIFQGKGIAADLLKHFYNTFVVGSDDPEELRHMIRHVISLSLTPSIRNRELIKTHFIRENINRKLGEIVNDLKTDRTDLSTSGLFYHPSH